MFIREVSIIVLVAACSRPAVVPASPLPAAAVAREPLAPPATPPVATPGTEAPSTAASAFPGKAVALPGASAPASLDFIAYERARSRVWVPVGVTGSVDVYDIATGSFARVDGFKTEEREIRGTKRTFGPSAAAVGDRFVYIGNRATGEVCAIDVKTLKSRPCLKLGAAPDAVAYAASTQEVWVTTPRDQSIAILDASKPGTLRLKATIKTDGAPECYAVDEARGLFFTNLEDKDRTVVIDMKSHASKATWNPSCGPDGPRGIAFDAAHDFVIVACTDHLQVLDAAHEGTALGRLETGAGVDNIDLLDGKVYVAAGKTAKLTVAAIDDKGQLTVVATADTAPGVRNAVADSNGNAYAADAQGARLLIIPAGKP